MSRFASCSTVLALVLLMGVSAIAADYPPAEPVTSISPAVDRLEAMKERARQMLEARDTAGLEALAQELRTSKDTLDGGTWLLTHFYRTAVQVPKERRAASEAMEFYEDWARSRPNNITAQVCYAGALVRHAWNARGSGRASSVTSEGWRLMQQRLIRAWRVLDRAKKLEEKCPGWFQIAQGVALGQGWTREEYFDLVNEAIALEPTYGNYYTNACYWLLPRWHGETGDFERWIEELADRAPADMLDRQYARLVWMADRMPVDGEIVFGPGRLDWERTKRGFEQWLASDPDNLNVRFQFTRLALIADDRETARAQFEITGGRYYPNNWENTEEFEQARRFAYEGGENPLKLEEKPRPRVSEERQVIIAQVLRVLSGLIGGTLAGLCLLWLALQRRRVIPGVIALFASAALGAAFGTLASIIPAGVLYLYLRKLRLEHPPRVAPTSGWIVLLWTLALAALLIVLQFGASALSMIPGILKNGTQGVEGVAAELMRDGTAFRQIVAGAWICLLALLAICGPGTRAEWMDKLGLHPGRPVPTLLWTAAIAIIITGLSLGLDPLMDDRTSEALKVMAEGVHSPFWFIVALIIAAPLFEELVFRGYAFSGWIGKIGPWGAILLPSLIFALCHIQYGGIGLAYIFGMGALLGMLRWKTGSVYPCIALHLINNAVQAVEMFRDKWPL